MTVIDEPWVCQADRDKQDEERVMSEIAPPAVCQVHGVTCQFAQDVSMPEYSCVGKCQYEDREAKSKEMPADILDTTNKLVNDYVNPHEPRPDYRPDLRKRIAAALFAEREQHSDAISALKLADQFFDHLKNNWEVCEHTQAMIDQIKAALAAAAIRNPKI